MLFRRFDGRAVEDVPSYRRLMPALMRGRNESAVYVAITVDLGHTLPWLDAQNRESPVRIGLFHVVLGALVRALHARPRLNRFVSGGRLYEREGIWISFAAKQRMDDDAPLSVVKRRFDASEPLRHMAAVLGEHIRDARAEPSAPSGRASARASSVSRKLALLARVPPPIMARAARLLRALDAWNLAPRRLIEDDPMYTSVFVANVGSIGLDAPFHHLYEHGNCPLFMVMGKVHDAPVVTPSGTIEARPVMDIRCTFDERVEDGLYCARALELLKQWIERPDTWA